MLVKSHAAHRESVRCSGPRPHEQSQSMEEKCSSSGMENLICDAYRDGDLMNTSTSVPVLSLGVQACRTVCVAAQLDTSLVICLLECRILTT